MLHQQLNGIDAKRFIKKLNSPSTTKEVESLKRADEEFTKIKQPPS